MCRHAARSDADIAKCFGKTVTLTAAGPDIMFPSDSAETLTRFLNDRGIADHVASARRVVTAFLDFYRDVPALGLDPEPESDIVLFQYGIHDCDNGGIFELDIARQFIEPGLEGDDAISQLRCTTRFALVPELWSLGTWNVRCEERSELAAFSEVVFASDGFKAVRGAHPIRREIRWERV